MIYLVTLQTRDGATQSIVRGFAREIPSLRCMSYERLFRDLRAPIGHYLFSDLDMLSHYEREVVVAISDALRSGDPTVRILNDPRRLFERYPLLRMLEREGINRFTVTRLDGGERPARFPVFIRCEDNHFGPETGLLHDAKEFDEATAALCKQGKLLKRRIAVEFCAQRDPDGLYRKYGVFNIGGAPIPYHVLRSEHWLVKRRANNPQDFAEELAFVKSNPHSESVARIFALAGIDYGRMDYTIVDGRVQVYEINTNPRLPDFSARRVDRDPIKAERAQISRDRFVAAFRELDTPHRLNGYARFELPEPPHAIRPWRPRARLMLKNFLAKYPSVRTIVPRQYW
jgi:hypothetical protein